MKKIVFLLLILLVSGCTSNYELEISNDSFKENISVVINKDEIPSKPVNETIETDDQITPFLENKYSALFSNEKAYYKKKVAYYGDYINVNMKYNYNLEEFKDSNSLNLCFEEFVFENEETYYIHAYGNFYCLYTNEININIKSNNKVIKNNATSVNGNIYTWTINDSNSNNVNIEFEVEKGFSWNKILRYGIIVTIILTVIFSAIYYIYIKRKKNNSID